MNARGDNHRKRNAERQQEDVRRRVRAALSEIEAEMKARSSSGNTYLPKERLSLALVLRRAGRIDKNTLKRPYHETLRKEVEAFLSKYVSKLDVRPKRPATRSMQIDDYAQMLVASRIAHEETEKKLDAAESEIKREADEIAALRNELEALR